MKRLAALVLAAATGAIGAAPVQACWWWPWGMGSYGYSAGYGGQYAVPSYPVYGAAWRPALGAGYPMGYASMGAVGANCCAPICCDPCGNSCSGGACGNSACAGTGEAQSGSSLKPQVDSNFQGGSGTYDADPTAPAGGRRTPVPKDPVTPADQPATDATFDAPATPRRSTPAGSTDDFNASGAATEEITPFGAETGVSNKPPVPEIKDLDPVQPESTFAPEPAPAAPAEAQPAADPAAGKPAAEETGSGDAFLPVEPTAPAPKPAVPEARRTTPGSVVAGQSSRMHEVLRPARLAQKPAVGSLTVRPVPDRVRWISAPLAEGHARL
jgi:hypothetical protein